MPLDQFDADRRLVEPGYGRSSASVAEIVAFRHCQPPPPPPPPFSFFVFGFAGFAGDGAEEVMRPCTTSPFGSARSRLADVGELLFSGLTCQLHDLLRGGLLKRARGARGRVAVGRFLFSLRPLIFLCFPPLFLCWPSVTRAGRFEPLGRFAFARGDFGDFF